ncbi:HDIG domain-containing metalloprotein [Aminipila sp.]|uniref:HDIG domain-containing metalloprotein n=1 Tax=Aminipila sp. TaxID=2060095 RepID=UPI00289A7D4C|nr:HDIG domain-containing metalloprotein [Aminipila sp.]
MTVEKKLFHVIDDHLLHEKHPSAYLNEISVLPEFEKYPFNMLLDLKKTEQDPFHHPEGDVWNHTMLVIDEAAKRKMESVNPKVFMWAALLHDIGKPAATKLRRGKLTAYDHDKIGEKLSKKFLLAVDAPETFTEQVSALVRFHMHILFVIKNMPYSDIKGLKNRTDLHEVALLGLCDRLGRTNSNLQKEEENIDLFLSKLTNKERI